ncbi:NAD(P)-dependent oxidoreductase [Legionella drozanskii]|uniref:Erythronate-4-phosphate dehydrogenase n=1 Tax=Legionella drozanskii LLAP-1 TaxID=1212489 RepID=A0A0W0SR00_9GAMM|nr:NAD(P)-dependent oxidoreductase [Legionella drozanskii]KTC85681.1 erythronate-4-phosphate dehydrogenase [Legionella drozanskii LLAP-1]
MKIIADASLPGLHQAFPKPFELSLYNNANELPELLKNQQVLICRATLKVNEKLLKGHALSYVATASSGTDHIDSLYLKNNSIQLIDAKGSNAIAVADYVIATLAYLQRYKNFSGSKAGVVGVGEVGSRVVKRLTAAGMEVICYDPIKAEQDEEFKNSTLEELALCNLISIHANLHDEHPYPSSNLFNESLLKQLKPNTVIINASRGGIVDEEALLEQKKTLIYCTDVFSNEPKINSKIIELATLCTPHVAGHSIEAKYRAIEMISEKLHAYMQLESPQFNFYPKAPSLSYEEKNWQDLALKLYNPLHETLQLKTAANLESAFLNLRKAHQNRYDFCCYALSMSNHKISKIFGF